MKSENKYCNQYFVKDSARNEAHTATMKCVCCEEELNLQGKYPFELSYFTEMMESFLKIHNLKGCNQNILEQPDWVSKRVNLSINIGKE